MPRLPAGCYLGFLPQREAGAALMLPRSPEGEALISLPVFRPPGEALRCSMRFRHLLASAASSTP